LPAASVSPVVVDLRPTPAAISPAMISSRSSRWFACIWRMRPTRSVRPVVVLRTRSPALSVPE
jgi:threonine synthase